jgi:putative addiction module component (TIGR02574 family)
MTRATQAVFDQALRLDAVERAELIDQLFRSFDAVPDRAVDAAWAGEAEARLDAFSSGELTADTAETVMERIAKR